MLKNQYYISPTFEGGVAKFAFSPVAAMLTSDVMMGHMKLYDQYRFGRITMRFTPYLPNATEAYMVSYRIARDDYIVTKAKA